MKFSLGFKKYFKNTSWLFFDRAFKKIVSFLVGIYVIRYLGPEKFGILSYSLSFVALFTALSALGLDNIVVRDLVRDKERRDEVLGTAFLLKLAGSIVLILLIAVVIQFIGNDSYTNLLIVLIASGEIFKSFKVIDFYFRSQVRSKYVVYAQVTSGLAAALLKLLFIFLKLDLIYFAAVVTIENFILALGLIYNYSCQKLRIFNWRPTLSLAKKLLKDSWPLVLSGLAVAVYMRIDQVMIKSMLGAQAVGNYAVAVRLSEVWYFIPAIITTSVFPAIINAKKKSEKLYYERLQNLYSLMIWVAIIIAVPLMLFAGDIIKLLFGTQYLAAIGVLKIYIWAGVFVFLGVASGKYLIAENYTKITFIRTFTGTIINVILNFVFIPIYGIIGSAWATIISYAFATFTISFFPKVKYQCVLMYKGINPLMLIRTK
jgi:O-antigen/teichoic acid export membrane protein